MGKYYAVVDGHSKKPMILESWEKCKKEVTGASGVKFKSFVRLEDAKKFIIDHGGTLDGSHEEQPKLSKESDKVIRKFARSPEEENLSTVEIYVDGSYETSTQRYAFGLVVVEKGEEIHASCGAYKDEYSSMRNVAGEVLGAQKAMLYAMENEYTQLDLYYDYQGIESWAKGTWKRNNLLTQGYYSFYQDVKQKLQVNFFKVKGHSGDRFNDRADQMAKFAFLK